MLGEVKVQPAEWDARFMKLALEVSDWSKDPKRHVGAVVVSPDKRQFSVGYNGFPQGVADLKDRLTSEEKNELMVHAELNALLNARRDLTGWTLYTTFPPCLDCAKAIAQSGVKRVVALKADCSDSWAQSIVKGQTVLAEAGVEYKFAELREKQ
jgi:dCMP deaminase